MSEKQITIISAADLLKTLTMDQCIQAMRSAFVQLWKGEAALPLRTPLAMEEENGGALFMPVFLPRTGKVGLKAVTIHKDNPRKGLPMIHAMVMVFDAVTGAPLALMDGEVLTAMRTGAASGLATDLLASESADTLALIGIGAQGRTQMEAVCAVRDIRRAYVSNLRPERAGAFAAEMEAALGLEVIPAPVSEALPKAQVVCTATSASTPVFSHADIAPGTHINAVGAYRADMSEIPPETIRAAKVVVDQVSAALSEAGDIVQPIEAGTITREHLHGELGQLVSGEISGRTSDDEITVFKSVGLAVQDLAAADLVLKNAEKLGVGSRVSI